MYLGEATNNWYLYRALTDKGKRYLQNFPPGQIRLNVGAFMQGLFRQGAFQGSSPRDAAIATRTRLVYTSSVAALGPKHADSFADEDDVRAPYFPYHLLQPDDLAGHLGKGGRDLLGDLRRRRFLTGKIQN